jgi:hypothetical protein
MHEAEILSEGLTTALSVNKMLDSLEQAKDEQELKEKLSKIIDIVERNYHSLILSKQEHDKLISLLKSEGTPVYLRVVAVMILSRFCKTEDVDILWKKYLDDNTEDRMVRKAILEGFPLSFGKENFKKNLEVEKAAKLLEDAALKQLLDSRRLDIQLYSAEFNTANELLRETCENFNRLIDYANKKISDKHLQAFTTILELINKDNRFAEDPIDAYNMVIFYIEKILEKTGKHDKFVDFLNQRLNLPDNRRFHSLGFCKTGNTETCRLLLANLPHTKNLTYETLILEDIRELATKHGNTPEFQALDFSNLLHKIMTISVEIKEKADSMTQTQLLANENLRTEYLLTLEKAKGADKTAKEIAIGAVASEDESVRRQYRGIIGELQDKESATLALQDKLEHGSEDEKKHAKEALSKVGSEKATDLLIAEDRKKLYDSIVVNPIKDLEDQSKAILSELCKNAQRTFYYVSIMGWITFAIGITIIVMGLTVALVGHNENAQLLFGGASIIAGATTVLLNFTKGPVSIVQNAAGDLAQIQAALLSNNKRANLASYLLMLECTQNKHKINVETFKECTKEIKNAAADTMLLIELLNGEKEIPKEAKTKLLEIYGSSFLGASLAQPLKGEEKASRPPKQE